MRSVSVAAPTLPTYCALEAPLPAQPFPLVERYRDFRLLGSGAKAEVWECRDDFTGRRVASKSLHARLAGDAEEQRLLIREARILAGLDHAGIPPLLDLGRNGRGQPFFTMPIIPGPTLRKILDMLRTQLRSTELTSTDQRSRAQGQWPLERLLGLIVAAADALAHAHDRGVVHCDVKPENLLIGRDDSLHLVDWGIAQVPGEVESAKDSPTASARTERPLRRGSPLYMSPEQALNMKVDPRTDVYALGAVLYECLTLRPAVRGRSVAEIMRNILQQDPVPPRLAAPERGISRELEAASLRALARSPADRHQTMDELRQELRECRLDLLVNFERTAPPWVRSPLEAPPADWWDLQATDAAAC
ncbi:MAG: serine/threonine protein kinase [Pirellulales bacterium]|nr:serine/threonine protein kinase [Pirellulales bacterium]